MHLYHVLVKPRTHRRLKPPTPFNANKELLRVPPPFYRDPKRKIRVPDATEKITFVVYTPTQRMNRSGDFDVIEEAILVRGWLVARASHTFAYYLSKLTDYDMLAHVVIDPKTEHTLWARGWDDETFAALSATLVME